MYVNIFFLKSISPLWIIKSSSKLKGHKNKKENPQPHGVPPRSRGPNKNKTTEHCCWVSSSSRVQKQHLQMDSTSRVSFFQLKHIHINMWWSHRGAVSWGVTLVRFSPQLWVLFTNAALCRFISYFKHKHWKTFECFTVSAELWFSAGLYSEELITSNHGSKCSVSCGSFQFFASVDANLLRIYGSFWNYVANFKWKAVFLFRNVDTS